jgi:NDP-sugar pyrophosphorylase family protein
VTDRGEVVRITGRGRTETIPTTGRMFAGIHILHPRLLRDVPVGKESSIIDAYVRGIQEGERILGYDFSGYWSDVGTPERYAQAERGCGSRVADSRLQNVGWFAWRNVREA